MGELIPENCLARELYRRIVGIMAAQKCRHGSLVCFLCSLVLVCLGELDNPYKALVESVPLNSAGFGLAVGLRPIGTSEEMADAQLEAGSGEEFGAIGGAAIGEDALDEDAMSLEEGEGLVEGGQDAGSFFIKGKSRALSAAVLSRQKRFIWLGEAA